MKKKYIVPSVETVNVRLIGSVLESANANMGNNSDETGVIEAKENNLEFEEDDTFTTPTQPNMWDDEEQ